MITAEELLSPPRRLLTEEEYLALITKDVIKDDPAYAASQAAHHRHLGRIWHERSVASRDKGFPHAAIAEQAASARCYWRARLYQGLED